MTRDPDCIPPVPTEEGEASTQGWPISSDGPHAISEYRHWLARQLLDSKLDDDEAFGIVAYHPSVTDIWKPQAPQDVAGLVEEDLEWLRGLLKEHRPHTRAVKRHPYLGPERARIDRILTALRASPISHEDRPLEMAAADAPSATGPTPGPWIVETTALHLWVGYPKAWAPKVSEVVCHFEVGPHYAEAANARCAANARLIASAPELLEAGRLALGLLTGNMDGDWEIGGDPVARLRAAIAKAEGGPLPNGASAAASNKASDQSRQEGK